MALRALSVDVTATQLRDASSVAAFGATADVDVLADPDETRRRPVERSARSRRSYVTHVSVLSS